MGCPRFLDELPSDAMETLATGGIYGSSAGEGASKACWTVALRTPDIAPGVFNFAGNKAL